MSKILPFFHLKRFFPKEKTCQRRENCFHDRSGVNRLTHSRNTDTISNIINVVFATERIPEFNLLYINPDIGSRSDLIPLILPDVKPLPI